MAYANINFKTKKAFKEAVKAWNEYQKVKDQIRPLTVAAVLSQDRIPKPISLWSPGPFSPATDGREVVEGPWYPEPHRWYAAVKIRNGIVEEVK